MRKLSFILLLSVLFIGCNGEWVPNKEKTKTVHVKDIGTFTVDGKITHNNGGLEFKTTKGLEIWTSHECVIVTNRIAPVQKQPQVQQPVKTPVPPPAAKKVPAKVPVEKPSK